MEDIRKLLNDHEAEIAPESLAFTVYGLQMAIADESRDSFPTDPAERRRHLEILGALNRAAELYSAALARYTAEHVDVCAMREE